MNFKLFATKLKLQHTNMPGQSEYRIHGLRLANELVLQYDYVSSEIIHHFGWQKYFIHPARLQHAVVGHYTGCVKKR
jgi:hypothetical protein